MKVIFKQGIDPESVREQLLKQGIYMRRYKNGSTTIFINRRNYLLALYPDLEPLYTADRAFWKSIRKRTRNGEEQSLLRDEIKAHATWLKNEEKRIISTYETHDRKALPPHTQGV